MLLNCSTKWLKVDNHNYSSTIYLISGRYSKHYATGLEIKMYDNSMNFIHTNELYLLW